jgi:hypothetical protein
MLVSLRHKVGLRRRKLTDDVVEGILLSPKHCATVEKVVWEIRSTMVFVKPKIVQSVLIFGTLDRKPGGAVEYDEAPSDVADFKLT